MKVVIIEDEKAAVRNLEALLGDIVNDVEIVAVLDCILDSVNWFRTNSFPDVVFMDIHLADGSAFEIFDHVDIRCPIIFTTAYDEYALKAFKVNSVDYLLKPFDVNDMRKAIDKFYLLKQNGSTEYESEIKRLIKNLKISNSYKSFFLVPVGADRLFPLPVDQICYFYIAGKIVKAVVEAGKEYELQQTLDELSDCLDPKLFFRVNRQYLIPRTSVKDITLWFNSRLSVNLKIKTSEKIVVSRARVSEFKTWFEG